MGKLKAEVLHLPESWAQILCLNDLDLVTMPLLFV